MCFHITERSLESMAPARVDMEDGIEIKFAQKLAGNEKEGRDKALRKLKKWIQLKSRPESSESGKRGGLSIVRDIDPAFVTRTAYNHLLFYLKACNFLITLRYVMLQ